MSKEGGTSPPSGPDPPADAEVLRDIWERGLTDEATVYIWGKCQHHCFATAARYFRNDEERAISDAIEGLLERLRQNPQNIQPSRRDPCNTFVRYVNKAIRNASIRGQRHPTSFLEEDVPDEVDPTDPLEKLINQEDMERMLEALNRLPEEERQLIVWHDFEGLSFLKIAIKREKLGSMVGKKQVASAKKRAERDYDRAYAKLLGNLGM